jgi:hypothetical protein
VGQRFRRVNAKHDHTMSRRHRIVSFDEANPELFMSPAPGDESRVPVVVLPSMQYEREEDRIGRRQSLARLGQAC